MSSHLLNILIWFPIITAVILLFIPNQKQLWTKLITLVSTFVTLILTVSLYFQFSAGMEGIQNKFYVKVSWINSLSINYTLGVDGISIAMALLTALLFFICTLSSWNVEKNIKSYFALLLLLQSSIFGVFFALDFFLFYVFWEVMLIPMYFLIALWGGENREYAATKFILYTFFGSILMLVGVIALYYASGKNPNSFDIIALQGGKFKDLTFSLLGSTYSFENFFFWILFLGFAIKVPVFPFHTWLPHAHVQAPTAVSVILAGVLLKMGVYGFIRIAYPIFPNAAIEYATIVAFLGLVSILYGAFCALAQTDVKKLIAYSSVSHMGFVMLGLSSLTVQGVNGAVMQMFNHGTSTAMMFLLVGMIYERSHHRWIIKPDGTRGFSGLAIQMPIYTIIFILGMFASIGLPGLSGFVSEFLIFMGSFIKFPLLTVISAAGLLLGAAYLLWMYKRMFFGEVSSEVKTYKDINILEVSYMIPLCFLVVFLGVIPSPLANLIKASVGLFVQQLSK